MSKTLLFSHSGFSDQDANGQTMKKLLSAWPPEEKAEFYCDVQPPDYSAAHRYFRLTDVQVMKSFLGKKSRYVLDWDGSQQNENAGKSAGKKADARKIPAWLKKYKYNFVLKWVREYLRILSPQWKKEYVQWLEAAAPDVLIYMVGESIFLDKLVLKACEKIGKPLVLYNGEAYRLIDLKKRKGLERAYYRKVEKLYARLDEKASLAIYNSEMLKAEYMAKYAHPAKAIVAYNSAECGYTPYGPGDSMNITYFGNLGVGRSDSLIQVAKILENIDPALELDIYGNATEENKQKFRVQKNICYHGFVNAAQLREIISASDILLHVESFDPEIVPKLKYAFSTKIAQCLCSGRCFVSYAPKEAASSAYLESQGFPVAGDETALGEQLTQMIKDDSARKECAARAEEIGKKNHRQSETARMIRETLEALI